MRRGLSFAATFLLIIAVSTGLAGCQREAPSRPTDLPQAGVTQVPGVSPGTGGTTPRPGETVVSAFTPVPQTVAPGASPQPTSDLTLETPIAPAPQPTAAPPPVATTAPPPPSGSTGSVSHTVQPGETLTMIAARYGTTVQAISQANGLTNPDQIYVGQKLKIPTGGGSTTGGTTSGGTTTGCRIRHTVKQGEWVWQIARSYGVNPYDILAANGLTVQTANTVYPGTVLCIP